MITRRSLLFGASAATMVLVMPAGASAPALDTEALSTVSQYVREGYFSWSHRGQVDLVTYALGHNRAHEIEMELLHPERAISAVNRMLCVGFRKLRIGQELGEEYAVPLIKDGRLTPFGQLVVCYLPIAPSDYHPNMFPALDRLAPHYLA